MRRAARVDSNHRVIVSAFRALGCSVQSLAAVGKGVPDLLVGFAGLNHLVEVKDGTKPKSGRKLTPLQVVWASTWRAPRHLVESAEDVQRLVKAWREVEFAMSALSVAHRALKDTGRMLATNAAPPDFDADDYNGRPAQEARATPAVIRAKGGA